MEVRGPRTGCVCLCNFRGSCGIFVVNGTRECWAIGWHVPEERRACWEERRGHHSRSLFGILHWPLTPIAGALSVPPKRFIRPVACH